MISAEALAMMTPDQRRRISLLGVQARELKRQAQNTAEFRHIRDGLQLAAITLDFRTPQPRMNHILLFDVGYHNRYLWMLNNREQPEIIGWTPAMRRLERQVRPLINPASLF